MTYSKLWRSPPHSVRLVRPRGQAMAPFPAGWSTTKEEGGGGGGLRRLRNPRRTAPTVTAAAPELPGARGAQAWLRPQHHKRLDLSHCDKQTAGEKVSILTSASGGRGRTDTCPPQPHPASTAQSEPSRQGRALAGRHSAGLEMNPLPDRITPATPAPGGNPRVPLLVVPALSPAHTNCPLIPATCPHRLAGVRASPSPGLHPVCSAL
ncbi:hypothetical protein AAFF_G00140590 [Aldrovandia affinis]|uniref:Uncharacterized protein n=1 Tax=Aldrovandia affinis TaxID=143900 RepID=A0AAD7X2X4_9TELE|nr:hypothetical protein AAFF_G00140590 [Aldrovandia affinis]